MSETSKGCTKVFSRVLQYNADCVEWCPVQRCASMLLCGTYQLKESEENKGTGVGDSTKNERIGKLYTFKLGDNENVELAKEHNMPGILDIKWSYKEICGRVTYAVANADGVLTLWAEDCNAVSAVNNDEADNNDGDNDDTDDVADDNDNRNYNNVSFKMIDSVSNKDGEDALALSLDWDNACDNNANSQIVVSYSDGSVGVNVVADNSLKAVNRWKAHDFEAWICAFDYHNTNVVYSGGDDCKFKVWDLRTDCSYPTFTSKKHEMGVCSVQKNFHLENILTTGSYDERVLFWDQRSMRIPLGEVGVGGGVWRVKWEPREAVEVAVAAMHGGFHVLDCSVLCGRKPASENDGTPAIIVSYHGHDSLAYGVDWCQLAGKESTTSRRLVASCSFYDRLLHLWTLND